MNSRYGSGGRGGPTRRQFLQGSAVAGLGAAAAMTGATSLINYTEVETVLGNFA